MIAAYAILVSTAFAQNWATYPQVPKTASINGFADPIYDKLPECAHSCVKESVGNTPCPYWDTGCICIMPQWTDVMAECVAKQCSGQDVKAATSLANSLCKSVGAWFTVDASQSKALDAAANKAAATPTQEATSAANPPASASKAPVASTEAAPTTTQAAPSTKPAAPATKPAEGAAGADSSKASKPPAKTEEGSKSPAAKPTETSPSPSSGAPKSGGGPGGAGGAKSGSASASPAKSEGGAAKSSGRPASSGAAASKSGSKGSSSSVAISNGVATHGVAIGAIVAAVAHFI